MGVHPPSHRPSPRGAIDVDHFSAPQRLPACIPTRIIPAMALKIPQDQMGQWGEKSNTVDVIFHERLAEFEGFLVEHREACYRVVIIRVGVCGHW